MRTAHPSTITTSKVSKVPPFAFGSVIHIDESSESKSPTTTTTTKMKNLPRILLELERNGKPANLRSRIEYLASPTGVDVFGAEEDAEMKFYYFGTDNPDNDLVISAITAITPDTAEEVENPRRRNKWMCQSDFSMIFGDDLLDEQEKPVKAPSTDFFGAERLITKSITPKALATFESSLGVLADKVADGYDLVASGLKVKLRSVVLR